MCDTRPSRLRRLAVTDAYVQMDIPAAEATIGLDKGMWGGRWGRRSHSCTLPTSMGCEQIERPLIPSGSDSGSELASQAGCGDWMLVERLDVASVLRMDD